MTIGHIIDRNLSESNNRDKDSRALDNLGGEGISNDISLFINNTNNISVIYQTEYIIQNEFIIITNPFVVPYSNRSIVIADETECIVVNSNFMDRFQLLKKEDNSVFLPSGDITRSDTIHLKHFESLNLERNPPTKSLSDTSISGLLSGGVNTESETDIYESLNIVSTISEIDETLSVFNFRKKNSFQLDRENNINNKVNIGGSILIENLDSTLNPITVQNTLTDNDPGIFLTNNGSKIRAFSDTTNPWNTETNVGYNTTLSTKATVMELKLENPNIIGISPQTETGDITDATHKIPVVINGEQYNILAILS